jgi:hypothetical protein
VRKFIISSVIGGSWVAGWISQPDPNPEIAGDRRKPAHSLRRFTGSALASGLATASYTINWDTTPRQSDRRLRQRGFWYREQCWFSHDIL